MRTEKAMLGNGALLLIDVQRGFHDPSWGQRNNLDAEKNINALLDIFRKRKMSVIHVQHISKDPSSPLRPDQPGVEFMEGIEPQRGEKVFKKDVNSAFIGTDLEEELKKDGLTNLFFIGFTSDHCVSTSARMAADLGFSCHVISDATVTFDRSSEEGRLIPASLVHEVRSWPQKMEHCQLKSCRVKLA